MASNMAMVTSSLLSFVMGAAAMAVLREREGKGQKRKRRSGEIQRQLEADGELDCDVNDLLSESDDEDNVMLPGQIRNFGLTDGPFKLLLLVNMELKMGKGKVAAQCCHATLGCYKGSLKYSQGAVRAWEYLGQAKICLKCPTEKEMWDIRAKAEEAGLVTYMVMDAGRTQIASGSRTVLGIGPAPVSAFSFTDHLKLM